MDARVPACLAAAGAIALWGLCGTRGVATLVGAAALGNDMGALEEAVAGSPDDGAARLRLARAYLDGRQPGLAFAVLAGRAPLPGAEAEAGHLRARSLFQLGRTREALAVERAAVEACRRCGCPAWQAGRLLTDLELYQALADAGIDDAARDPEGARAAHGRAVRLVGLAAGGPGRP